MERPFTLINDGDGEFAYIDQDGVSHTSPSQWLFTGIMGGCGCGSSEEFADEALKLLNNFALPHDKRNMDAYSDRFTELLAHWLDSAGLIEHGSNIGGSWLSEKGQQVHDAIKKLAPLT